MATEKILNTRIVNKHAELITKDGVKGWDQSTLKLKEGEIALAKVTVAEQHAGGKISEVPAYLVKIGVEGKTFNETAWAYAKAADVYAWAKQENLPVKETGSGNAITKIEYGTWTEADKTIYGIIVTKGATFATQAELEGYKTKQTAYSAPGSTIKTVTKVEQNANGEVAVTYENIDFPELPDENDFGVLTVNKKDGTAIEVDNTNAQNPKVGFKIATTQGDNVTVTQSNDGLKVEVDQTHNHDDEYAELGHKHTSGDITDFSNAVAAVKVTNAANADNATNATSADNAAKLEGKTTDEIKVAFTGAIADKETGFVTGDAVYDVKLTADDAKSKIDTFLASVTPDGADNIIDTLQEINDYVGEHGEAFATLSNKVTNIENGTTAVPKATHAVNADNATKAADSDKLGGQAPAYYATAASVTDITKTGGAIDTKIAALNTTVTGMDAGKTIKTLTETDGIIAAEFQDIAITKSQVTDFEHNHDDVYLKTQSHGYINSIKKQDYTKGDIDKYITIDTDTSGDYGNDVCFTFTTELTTALGAAETALQTIGAPTVAPDSSINTTEAKVPSGIKVTAKANNTQDISIDDSLVWIFDCGGAE